MRTLLALTFSLSFVTAGCHESSSPGSDLASVDNGDLDVDLGADGPKVTDELAPVSVSGQVVAFEDEMPLSGSVTVTTQGLSPMPTATVTGSSFTLDGVTAFSVFSILAGSPPDYRNTYNFLPSVKNNNVSDVKAYVVAEATLTSFATTFGVTPTAGKAILFAQLVDGSNAGVASVPAAALQLNGAAPAKGPYFLDATKAAAAGMSQTSASGWVVFFDVDPGLVQVTTPMASGFSLMSPEAPAAANLVTIVKVPTMGGSVVLPTNVSFSTDVVPIFTNRGCVSCHSASGPGKDLGGLQLNGGTAKVYTELTVEISPNTGTTRVDLTTPENSLVLTRPSFENPPDVHPNVTFASNTDPDYLKILVWIREGAKNN